MGAYASKTLLTHIF